MVGRGCPDAQETPPALEGFLALEASGWKACRNTALASERGRAEFARAAVRDLAAAGLCRIHRLELDGRTIASLVVFAAGGVAYAWKTAYDKLLAAFSPGTLLLLIEVTESLLADPAVAETDSCASDHPVMNRMWTERRPVGGVLVGLSPAAEAAVHRAARQLALVHRAHAAVRRARQRVGTVPGRRRG